MYFNVCWSVEMRECLVTCWTGCVCVCIRMLYVLDISSIREYLCVYYSLSVRDSTVWIKTSVHVLLHCVCVYFVVCLYVHYIARVCV